MISGDLVTCEKSGAPCRHCSEEYHYEEQLVIFKGRLEKRTMGTPIGQFCNNDGTKFVRDLSVCPATEKPTKPFIPWNEISELEWMQRRS